MRELSINVPRSEIQTGGQIDIGFLPKSKQYIRVGSFRSDLHGDRADGDAFVGQLARLIRRQSVFVFHANWINECVPSIENGESYVSTDVHIWRWVTKWKWEKETWEQKEHWEMFYTCSQFFLHAIFTLSQPFKCEKIVESGWNSNCCHFLDNNPILINMACWEGIEKYYLFIGTNVIDQNRIIVIGVEFKKKDRKYFQSKLTTNL